MQTPAHLLGGRQIGSGFAKCVFQADLPVLEIEDVDTIGLNTAAICRRAYKRPLRHAKIALYKMNAIDPLRIWHGGPGARKGLPNRLWAHMPCTAGIRATGGLKYAVRTHETHQGVDVMSVPCIAEGRQTGFSNSCLGQFELQFND